MPEYKYVNIPPRASDAVGLNCLFYPCLKVILIPLDAPLGLVLLLVFFSPPLLFPCWQRLLGETELLGAQGSAPDCKTGKILKPREGREDECMDVCHAFNTVRRSTGEGLRRR